MTIGSALLLLSGALASHALDAAQQASSDPCPAAQQYIYIPTFAQTTDLVPGQANEEAQPNPGYLGGLISISSPIIYSDADSPSDGGDPSPPRRGTEPPAPPQVNVVNGTDWDKHMAAIMLANQPPGSVWKVTVGQDGRYTFEHEDDAIFSGPSTQAPAQNRDLAGNDWDKLDPGDTLPNVDTQQPETPSNDPTGSNEYRGWLFHWARHHDNEEHQADPPPPDCPSSPSPGAPDATAPTTWGEGLLGFHAGGSPQFLSR
jgi:hypothetical protein